MEPHVELIPGAPILIAHQTGPIADVTTFFQESADFLATLQEPIFLIIDLLNFSMDLGEHMKMSDAMMRGAGSSTHHTMLREVLYVSEDPVVEVVVKGMNSATFGFVKARLFKTIDEALDYCYEQLGRARPPEGSGGKIG